MIAMRPLRALSLVAAAIALTACDHTPQEWKTPNMTNLTPRLEPLFEKTKTVCFGRFLVDLPQTATVTWGNISVPIGVRIYPDGAKQVDEFADKFISQLSSEKAIYHDRVPLLISEDKVSQPQGRIITGYENYTSINALKINGYFKLENDGVVIDARPLQYRKDQVIAEIKSIARRLQLHDENDIPTEPGNCIEYAFLPDKDSPNAGHGELIRIGFRLKEFPDVHLSILLNPSNPHYSDSDSLQWQLERLEKDQRAENPNHPLLKTRYLRRGPRQIHDWISGFEALSHTPEQADMHGIHDFAMDFRGVASDPLKPHADIRMQTGVDDNLAGAIKPSLTDEEAIAVWDKITSTIRVRPTSGAALKTSQSDSGPRRPLGDLAATGRVCPQTGWWQPSEPDGKAGGGRQHFQAGEQMPHVVTIGEPSLWQKLRGERPTYRRATVWQLVEYGDAPPTVAQSSPTDTATKRAPDDKAEGGDEPLKKG